jgi:peptidoglycan/LPS O-acetylase OafA/YrhL
LLTVTAATMACGYALFLPYELEQLAASATATVSLVPNIYFWRTADYFMLADGITPLLHCWSLGVEEQFYLLFPALLVLAERLGRTRTAVAAIGAASLMLCLAATPRMPVASFYLLPTRGWELMLGAALALGMVRIGGVARNAAGIAGIALILAASLLLSPDDPFPGWRALLPAVGALLVIGSGSGSIVGRALSNRLLVYVGRISYSFYLWHWPVFVFLRHWRADVDLPLAWAVGGIAAAFVLSAASYRWIEQPARRRSTNFGRVLIPCLGGAAIILAACLAAIVGKGLPQRLPARVDAIAAAHFAYAPLAHSCTDVGFDYPLEHCRIGPRGAPQLLLWGDSHAAAISEAVVVGTGKPGVLISLGTCSPVLDGAGAANPAYCRAMNQRALHLAETDAAIITVVLSAFWAAHDQQGAQFWKRVQAVVDRLDAAGKTVVVVAGVPDPGIDVPWASAIRERFGRTPLRIACPRPRIPLHGIRLVDVSAGFCGKPPYLLFTDSNHPSRYAGLSIIAPALRNAMKQGDR